MDVTKNVAMLQRMLQWMLQRMLQWMLLIMLQCYKECCNVTKNLANNVAMDVAKNVAMDVTKNVTMLQRMLQGMMQWMLQGNGAFPSLQASPRRGEKATVVYGFGCPVQQMTLAKPRKAETFQSLIFMGSIRRIEMWL